MIFILIFLRSCLRALGRDGFRWTSDWRCFLFFHCSSWACPRCEEEMLAYAGCVSCSGPAARCTDEFWFHHGPRCFMFWVCSGTKNYSNHCICPRPLFLVMSTIVYLLWGQIGWPKSIVNMTKINSLFMSTILFGRVHGCCIYSYLSMLAVFRSSKVTSSHLLSCA